MVLGSVLLTVDSLCVLSLLAGCDSVEEPWLQSSGRDRSRYNSPRSRVFLHSKVTVPTSCLASASQLNITCGGRACVRGGLICTVLGLTEEVTTEHS